MRAPIIVLTGPSGPATPPRPPAIADRLDLAVHLRVDQFFRAIHRGWVA